MQTWHVALALVLFLTVIVGLVRILRGPTPADRMLAAQLFGTTGVAIILLLSRMDSRYRPYTMWRWCLLYWAGLPY